MSDFLKDFLAGGVEETTAGSAQKITMVIKKITGEKDYEFAPGYTHKKAIVFHFESKDGKYKVTKGQSLLKQDGTDVSPQGMFRDMNWYKGEVKRATVMFDVKEALKAKIGEKKYEELKKENEGKVSSKMFLKEEIDMYLIEGTSNGEPFTIINLPLEQQFNDWKRMIDKGNVEGWEDIEEVREKFPEAAELYESTKNRKPSNVTKDVQPDDLPF